MWLRSPGVNTDDAAYVNDIGCVSTDGNSVNHNNAVCPALHVSLSSSPLTKVGTVTAEAEQEYRTDASGKPAETEKPETTPKPGTTEEPDATGKPPATQAPRTTGQPGSASPTEAPAGSPKSDPSVTAQNLSVSVPPEESHGNRTTKLNIKNKKNTPRPKRLPYRMPMASVP